METIRLLIVDDHLLIRKGIRALIRTEAGIDIVGEADNGQDAVTLAEKLDPDVIVLDLVMPVMDGVEAIEKIKRIKPEAKILVLTSFDDDDKILKALKAGAHGYLLKDSSAIDLIESIRQVHRGKASLDPSVAMKLIEEMHNKNDVQKPIDSLTERETEVLSLIARGLSNSELARELVISENTVRNHINHILSKLHLENRTQLTLYALREGITTLK